MDSTSIDDEQAAATAALFFSYCLIISAKTNKAKSAVANRIARRQREFRCDAWISSAKAHMIHAQAKCRWKIFCGGRSTAQYPARGTLIRGLVGILL